MNAPELVFRSARESDETRVLELASSASRDFDEFVFGSPESANGFWREIYLSRLADFGIAYSSVLESTEGVIALFSLLKAQELRKLRLLAGVRISRSQSSWKTAEVVHRLQLASRTNCKLSSQDVYLSRLAVDLRLGSSGIGRRVLRAAVAAAREHHASRLVLDVSAKNTRAINLYLSEGFVCSGREMVQDEHNGAVLEQLHLSLDIAPDSEEGVQPFER